MHISLTRIPVIAAIPVAAAALITLTACTGGGSSNAGTTGPGTTTGTTTGATTGSGSASASTHAYLDMFNALINSPTNAADLPVAQLTTGDGVRMDSNGKRAANGQYGVTSDRQKQTFCVTDLTNHISLSLSASNQNQISVFETAKCSGSPAATIHDDGKGNAATDSTDPVFTNLVTQLNKSD